MLYLDILNDKPAVIDSKFASLFDELEKGHLDTKERLNAFKETGEELNQRLLEEMIEFESWRFQIMDQLGEITEDFNPTQQSAHQQFIRETKYFAIVQEAPFYWRIINKPNGYAGDADMMSYIYRNEFEGDSPFGKFIHKHAVSTKACESVRNRKRYLTEQILKTEDGRILSLAAGPAEEIKETIGTAKKCNHEFVALDHDLDTLKKYKPENNGFNFTYALANAFQIISENYFAARPRSLFENYCFPRTDFKGLRKVISSLKYEVIDLKERKFNLIYSAGLYDYIKTFPLDDSKGSVALTKNLFALLESGGTLMVGNFNRNNPRDLRFVMEYIYDWQLIYRDKYDIMEFVRSIDENEIKSVQIIEEPLGINYFLLIEKV